MPMFLYDTHVHSAVGSLCASCSHEELIDEYLSLGFTGIFLTEHFLNGNTAIPKGLSYKERIGRYGENYYALKTLAEKRGLSVFFGIEYSYLGTDFLFYGLSPEWYEKQSEDFPRLDVRRCIAYVKKEGAFVSQAHPFREDFYIDHIRLFPNAEGVETFNAGRTERCNKLGEFYADAYGKIRTGGSDLHSVRQKVLAGMEFEEKITSERDFLRLLREGKGRIVVKENKFVQSVIK